MRLPWLVVVAVLAAGCSGEPAVTTTTPAGTSATPPTVTSPSPTPGEGAPLFDGQRAYDHVVAQVQYPDGSPRYRTPGTEGNREVARYIDATMGGLGFEVGWERFNASFGCVDTPMHNIVAERPGTSGGLVIFMAHYDSRPVADKDPDPQRRHEPVLGANDAGSGVGVLLELARVLPPSDDAVRFVFFDGEDGGGYKAPACRTEWILGSTHHAREMSAADVNATRAVVLVDMVGDPALVLPREGNSVAGAPTLVDEVYARGRALGHDAFVDTRGPAITDDHVPFLQRGMPAIDLIHTVPGKAGVFPDWHHTLDDDLDVVSAESLAAVGETLETWFRLR